VRFVKTVAGKWMILDDGPVRGGNVTIVGGVAQVYRDWEAAIDAHPCLPLYQDHHVTCPQAKEWRRDALG
jgi:hypothetical protein